MKKKILVVEDDQSIREVLCEILELEGYDIVSSVNGQEALDYLNRESARPDLILLDLMMPVKDGFAFRDEQKADPKINMIPVIIMSADGNVSQKMAKLNASSYLKKPVDIDDVLNLVKDTLSLATA